MSNRHRIAGVWRNFLYHCEMFKKKIEAWKRFKGSSSPRMSTQLIMCNEECKNSSRLLFILLLFVSQCCCNSYSMKMIAHQTHIRVFTNIGLTAEREKSPNFTPDHGPSAKLRLYFSALFSAVRNSPLIVKRLNGWKTSLFLLLRV